MKRSFRFFLYIFLALLALSIAYGLYFYFKPMKAVSAQEADFKMTDVQLLNEFSHSDTSADARYKDKILELSGILKKSETDNQAANAVFDKGGTVIIVAAFVPAEREALSQLAQGALLHFKGQYRGYIKGDELFGTPAEIKIDQCSILK